MKAAIATTFPLPSQSMSTYSDIQQKTWNLKCKERIYDNIGYEYEEECQSEAETTTSPYKPSHTKVFLIDQVCTMKKKKGRGANTLYYRYAYATDDREDDAMYVT